MNSKVEKYINFVLQDLISKTEFNENDVIYFYPPYAPQGIPASFTTYGNNYYAFKPYVKNAYGATEDDCWVIFMRYADYILNKMDMKI